jgi:hypothetical protein
MAKSDYELFTEIFSADEVHRLLEADVFDRCASCNQGKGAAAHKNLTELGTWWAELGRDPRGVRSRITVNRRIDGEGCEAWFAIQVPRWSRPIRILLLIVRHPSGEAGTRKKQPHYQLQVPCVKELRSDVNKSGYEARVNTLAEQLRTRFADLQPSGVSIPLADASADDLAKIKKEVGALIGLLGHWEWGPV